MDRGGHREPVDPSPPRSPSVSGHCLYLPAAPRRSSLPSGDRMARPVRSTPGGVPAPLPVPVGDPPDDGAACRLVRGGDGGSPGNDIRRLPVVPAAGDPRKPCQAPPGSKQPRFHPLLALPRGISPVSRVVL